MSLGITSLLTHWGTVIVVIPGPRLIVFDPVVAGMGRGKPGAGRAMGRRAHGARRHVKIVKQGVVAMNKPDLEHSPPELPTICTGIIAQVAVVAGGMWKPACYRNGVEQPPLGPFSQIHSWGGEKASNLCRLLSQATLSAENGP